MILGLLSYIGLVTGVLALVFSIATVLYYISEQLEEHTVPAKRYITKFIYFVMGTYTLLWLVDGLPLFKIAVSLGTNYLYLLTMRSFPVLDTRNPAVIGGLIGTIVTHFMWFSYFNNNDLPPYSIYNRIPTYKGETLPPFGQIVSFFGLLVWTVPLLLFLSLSANDQVLPTAESSQYQEKSKQRSGLAKQVVLNVWQWLSDALKKVGVNIKSPSSERDLPL